MNWNDFPSDTPMNDGLKVAVVCDDDAAAVRAFRVLDAVGSKWGFQLRPRFSRFDQIKCSRDQQRTTADVARAAFVLVSLSRPDEMPELVEQWLEACVQAKNARSTTWLTHHQGQTRWNLVFVDVHAILGSPTDTAEQLDPAPRWKPVDDECH